MYTLSAGIAIAYVPAIVFGTLFILQHIGEDGEQMVRVALMRSGRLHCVRGGYRLVRSARIHQPRPRVLRVYGKSFAFGSPFVTHAALKQVAFDVFALFVIVVNALHRPYRKTSDVISGLRRDGVISFVVRGQ